MESAALEKLKSVFADSMPLPDGVNYNEVAYGKTGGWDSVAHMALIAQIEAAFDVMLATEDVIELSSFPKARQILGTHGISFK